MQKTGEKGATLYKCIEVKVCIIISISAGDTMGLCLAISQLEEKHMLWA